MFVFNRRLAAARHSPIKQVCRLLRSPCTNARFIYECFFAREFHEFKRNVLNYINVVVIGRKNFH